MLDESACKACSLYVKRNVGTEIRRGVVFVKEIVPRRALAWVANAVYNEKYVRSPCRTKIACRIPLAR